MNYAGSETLRADVTALANAMYDLRTTLNALESRYRYDVDLLTERLARQAFYRINSLYSEAFREIMSLDACFKG